MSAFPRCSLAAGSSPVPDLQALIVDWGGVLTSGLDDSMRAWCELDGIEYGAFREVMRTWLGADAVANPIHALERGEVEVPHFEEQLAAHLVTVDGQPVQAAGLLARMVAGFAHAPDRHDVVRRARASGLKTGLLSNSWGNDYPREEWDALFDDVVISGEVGLRKPESEIFELAASRLGVAPQACVFVDDLSPNVRGAVAAGMVGVLHVTVEQTRDELEALFGRPLR
jgi:epoxide hydrolase-like predicted phosphatase